MESELQKILKNISPTLSVKVWLSHDGDTIMSPGLVSLLVLVSSEGSLSAAAKHLDWSYRMAWGRLRKAEKTLGLPLVEKLSGNKGGLHLTQTGQELVEKYEAWSKAVRKAAEEESQRFFTDQVTTPGVKAASTADRAVNQGPAPTLAPATEQGIVPNKK